MAAVVGSVATQVESQSANLLVLGFSLASALAWYDVVKALVARIVKVNSNGLQGSVLTALLTTLLAIVVGIVLKMTLRNITVAEPGAPVFAVTR